MAELALDHVQRHALARQLDGVGVTELVRSEAPAHAGLAGESSARSDGFAHQTVGALDSLMANSLRLGNGQRRSWRAPVRSRAVLAAELSGSVGRVRHSGHAALLAHGNPLVRATPSLRRWPDVANHKRRRPKHHRAGCLLCKPNKLTANKKAGRTSARREWRRREEAGG
jgi:hypothetical protein